MKKSIIAKYETVIKQL